MNIECFLQDNFSRFASRIPLAPLFEHLPDIHLYVKNAQSQFLHANTAFVRLLGASCLADVLGKTDHDFFPKHLADDYRTEDIGIINGTITVVDKMWLVPRANRNIDWFFSTKLPLQGHLPGEVAGLAGYIRDCRASKLKPARHVPLNAVVDYVLQNYSHPISTKTLAELIGLSVSQLDRRFNALYQMTPQEFILRVRMKAASQLLATTDESITNIAIDTGFFDQSHFSKFFHRIYAMSPKKYRDKYATNDLSLTTTNSGSSET